MKKTKKEMFTEILTIVADNAEMVEFLNHEIAMLEKKSSASKFNAKQLANVGIKNEIIQVLKGSENAMTITEIAKSLDTEYSNQKVSALVSQLVKTGEVNREVVKKVAKFTAA